MSILNNNIFRFICFLIIILSVVACSNIPSTDTKTDVSSSNPKNSETINEDLSKTDEILKNMTLREKIGQMFIIRPESIHGEFGVATTEMKEEMYDSINDYPFGGIILFGKNINTPNQLTSFVNSLKKSSKIQPFISIDEEGGSVVRIANNEAFEVQKFKSMLDIGNTNNPQEAYLALLDIGTYLNEYGFNLDFAPVADLYTNPENKVIGSRSFGSDPITVSNMVETAIKGLHHAGIMTCIKHFPGHGDTTADTHDGYAIIEKNWEELLECELIPFIKGIAAGTDMVMVAHITPVNITTDNLPASLSYDMITKKLRGELGFDGVVITDGLEMKAITDHYSSKEIALIAVEAGIDILLIPEDYRASFDALVEAVENGSINEDRIDESVRRILKLKETYNLL